MTIHKDVWGQRDMMHMHGWSDGGGTYGTVVELMPNDEARVTLISDTVETFPAVRIELSDAGRKLLWDEYQSTEDYANADASDVAELAGTRYARTYVIMSHGIVFAVDMFGTLSEDD